MKNIVIIVLLAAVAVMGTLLVTRHKTPVNNGQSSATSSTSGSAKTSPSSNGLNLSGKGLTEVPKNLLTNSTVTSFDVSNNNLTGSLPAEIRHLTNLETLNASNNKMTGIPAEIGQLSKLRVANFANNNLSGLPFEIGNLHALQTLDLRGNPHISQNDLPKIRTNIPNAQILTD